MSHKAKDTLRSTWARRVKRLIKAHSLWQGVIILEGNVNEEPRCKSQIA